MKIKVIASWIIAVLLALAFLGAGVAKLTSQPMMVAEFALFGLPPWFLYVTGTIEVVSAVLLVIPRTTVIGGGLIVCVMIGALIAHLTHGQAAMIGAPLVLLILAGILIRLRTIGSPVKLSPA
jgi:uncharacterized membrane protein YphA (DoxX/SURF4 family)